MKKLTIEQIQKRYKIEDNEVVITKDFQVIRKTGIRKIAFKEGISIAIKDFQVQMVATKVGLEDAVFMTGTGKIRNEKGFVIDEVDGSASATPFNCTHNYKMEVAEARLKSRITLDLAGLTDWLSEDELQLNQQAPSDDTGRDLIESALGMMNKGNR